MYTHKRARMRARAHARVAGQPLMRVALPPPPGQHPPRVSRVAMSVSSANASFIELRVSGGLGEQAAPDRRRPLYYGEEDEGSTVLCHKRQKMTTVGERVVRLILYQTKGW